LGGTARRITVYPGQSIQDAVDAIAPGGTIYVMPGTYQETHAGTDAVTVSKDGVKLIARSRPSHGEKVILQAGPGQRNGIVVQPAVANARINGFKIKGFTIQGFPGFGVYLACVDRFTIRGNTATANDTYAIFPVRSSRGHMSGNRTSGTKNDACLYVGQDESVDVHGNVATDCIIGFEIENSHHVRMVGNVSIDNTAGMLVDVVGNREVTDISDNVVARNILANNNRPNTASPDEDTSQIIPGIGLILEGADNTLLTRNRFDHNNLAGLALLNPCVVDPAFCTPPIDFDPNPDGNRVTHNRFTGNTTDVIFLPGGGQNNCFAKNEPASLTAVGGPLPTCP